MPKHLLPLALAVLFAHFPSAHAAEVDVTAGGSATVGMRWAPVAFLDVSTSQSYEWAGLHWQPIATVGWIGSRNDTRDDLDHDVGLAGAGVRLVDWWGGAFVGFEIGYASQRTDALSSHEQFISSLGWRGDRLMLMVRHISNGDLFGGRNLGETMLLAGVTF
jgi:hypothetical protein